MTGAGTRTVTFLFTDIEGSTRRWEQWPDAMRIALARHDAILRASIGAHRGTVFKTVGDAFYATFDTASDAVAAAVKAQLALAFESWGRTGPLRVRMAIHTGAVEHRDGDFFGPPLNRVARMLSSGHGGQILLSLATAELGRDALPEGVTLRPLGEHRFKDLQRPELIFQVQHPDLSTEFPPLASLGQSRTNLPAQLTSFVGREQQVAEVLRLLTTTPLLTLTGAGGLGKTRLALHAAAEALDAYPDGVWLAELAALTDPALVLQAVATVLGIREDTGRALSAMLVESLAQKSLLLVLDNCEHLLQACAELVDLVLRGCPSVHILATTRESLNIAGETVWRVPSLTIPDVRRPPTAEALAQSESAQLFIDRAGAAQPGFHLTDQNAPAVAQICHRLDGIPLALELAAARVKALTPEQIAVRLDDRFRLLAGGSRTALPRQQTLRALVDWSYDLLPETERSLFRRLAVFSGGWTLEAAEAICADQNLASADVLDCLSGLVEKSLVSVEAHHGVARYRLLETLRHYALEKLDEVTAETEPRRRHRDWFAQYAEETATLLGGPRQAEAFDRLDLEYENFRAALDRCDVTPDGWDVGSRLAETLAWFWILRGHRREAQARLVRLLEVTPPDTAARARTLVAAGVVAHWATDAAASESYFREGLRIWRALGHPRGIAVALARLALVRKTLEDYDGAWELLQESARYFQTAGGESGLDAPLVVFLAQVAKERGDDERATELFTECLEVSRARGDRHAAASALRSLGELAQREGDEARAITLMRESLLQLAGLDDKPCTADTLEGLAHLAAAQGQWERSVRLLAATSALQDAFELSAGPARRSTTESVLAGAQDALGKADFQTVWDTGHKMSIDAVLEYALDGSDDYPLAGTPS